MSAGGRCGEDLGGGEGKLCINFMVPLRKRRLCKRGRCKPRGTEYWKKYREGMADKGKTLLEEPNIPSHGCKAPLSIVNPTYSSGRSHEGDI